MLYLSDVLGSFLFGTRTVGPRVALLGAPPRVEAEGAISPRDFGTSRRGLADLRFAQSLPLGMSGRALGCLDFLPLFSRPLWFWRPSFFGAGPTSFGPDLSLPPNGGGLVVFTTLVELVFFDRIADRIFVPQYPSSSSRAITGSRGSCVKVVADFHKRKRLPLLKFIASPPTPASASQMQSVRPNSAPGRRWLRWLQRHGGRARVWHVWLTGEPPLIIYAQVSAAA